MQISYREMLPSDKSRIIELFYDFCELYKEMDNKDININSMKLAEWCLDDMQKEIDKTEGKIIVAQVGDKVIGFIGFFVKKAQDNELLYHKPHNYGIVYNLYVDDAYRNNKVGTELLKLAEDYFKEKNCKFSKLEVFGTNDKAFKFYERKDYSVRNFDLIKKL